MSTIDLVLWGIIAGMSLITLGRLIEDQPASGVPEPAPLTSDQAQRSGKTSVLEKP